MSVGGYDNWDTLLADVNSQTAGQVTADSLNPAIRFKDGTQGYATFSGGNSNGYTTDDGTYIAPSSPMLQQIFYGNKNSQQIEALTSDANGGVTVGRQFAPDNSGIVGGFLQNPAVLLAAAAVTGGGALAAFGGDAAAATAIDIGTSAVAPGAGSLLTAADSADAALAAFDSAVPASALDSAFANVAADATASVAEQGIPQLVVSAQPLAPVADLSSVPMLTAASFGLPNLPSASDITDLLQPVQSVTSNDSFFGPNGAANALKSGLGLASSAAGLATGALALNSALNKPTSANPFATPLKVPMISPQENATQKVNPIPVGNDTSRKLASPGLMDFFNAPGNQKIIIAVVILGVIYYVMKHHGASSASA